MKTIFKGDTFIFNYKCEMSNNELYEFNPNEILNVIIYQKTNKNKYVNKLITINEPTKEVTILFESSFMKTLNSDVHILEVKLMKNDDVFTTYQEEINVVESWCINE